MAVAIERTWGGVATQNASMASPDPHVGYGGALD
jgi:hypothetical protein